MVTKKPAKPSRPSVKLVQGHATTTSHAVAQYFGKRHDNVIRAIENLKAECPPDYHLLNFEPMIVEVDIGKGATRKDPAYQLTRDGFVLLAMGFTGKAALAWKIRYIEAFNKLEQRVTERTVTLAKRKLLADQAAERRKALPPPPKALPVLTDELRQRIDQRAWQLSHAAYDDFRACMLQDPFVQGRHTRPEDWQPLECRKDVLELIFVTARSLEAHANSLHRRGQRLARLVGEDYVKATAKYRPPTHPQK